MPSNQLDQTVGILVSGRVQGVGFRWWTLRTAVRLGLSGTVRNLAGGSVEVRVRGTADAINKLQDRLLVGPPEAVVSTIQTFPVVEFVSAGFRVLP